MARKQLFLALATAALMTAGSGAAFSQEKIKIGFLPGVVDPFYQVMQIGVEKAAAELGIEVVTQIPPTWGVEAQTPLLNALVARGDLNYIITPRSTRNRWSRRCGQRSMPASRLSPSIPSSATAIMWWPGDFPDQLYRLRQRRGRAHLRARSREAVAARAPFINSTNPNVSSVEGREQGFAEVMKNEFPDIKVLGPDYNLDDANKAAQQTAAIIEQNPDLAGVFGTNVFSAQGAGNAVVNAGLGGHVQVVAYDATKDAIESLNKGDVTLVLAQKPFDMGYMAVQFAAADAAGVTSLPKRVRPASPSSTRRT